MWLAEDAIWLTAVARSPVGLSERSPVDPLERLNVERANVERKGVHLKLTFPGANPHPQIEPFDRLDTKVSYFIGTIPASGEPTCRCGAVCAT